MKKDAHIVRVVGNNLAGGARKYCYLLNMMLASRGMNTRTFIPKAPIDDPLSDADKVPFAYVHFKSHLTYLKHIFLNKKRIRYTQLHLRNVSIIGGLACSILGIPYFITIHAPVASPSSFRQKILAILFRISLGRASGVIAISKFVLEDTLKKTGAIKVNTNQTVIYNGSEDALLSGEKVQRFDNNIAVAVVGEITERKGIRDYKELFDEIERKVTESGRDVKFHFNFYGQGPLEHEILALEEYGGKFVSAKLCGYRRDIARIFLTHDAHVIIAKNEAFGRVISEAMSAYCPTFAVNSGAFPEIITSELDGFIANTLEQLAQRLASLTRTEIQDLGSNARKTFAEKFSTELSARATVEFIEKSLDRENAISNV